ncbi:MAG: 6-carboxytetrahydropterin synthase [Nitrospirales bacterium]
MSGNIGRQVTCTQTYYFSAAHRLHTPQLSDDINRKIFGKCNNPNGHGHNYTVLVTVVETVDAPTGTVWNRDDLDQLVQAKIVDRFDHKHLNYDPAFSDGLTTTGENLARVIWGLLVHDMPSGKLQKVGVIETRDNYFEYMGDT